MPCPWREALKRPASGVNAWPSGRLDFLNGQGATATRCEDELKRLDACREGCLRPADTHRPVRFREKLVSRHHQELRLEGNICDLKAGEWVDACLCSHFLSLVCVSLNYLKLTVDCRLELYREGFEQGVDVDHNGEPYGDLELVGH